MTIVTYCITFPEEYDVLPTMIIQAKALGDVWLFDAGMEGVHCQNPRPEIPKDAIFGIAQDYECRYNYLPWPGQPGEQRNAALAIIGNAYDWIIQNDSDEFWPDQSVNSIPKYLRFLPADVTNVLVRMIHFVDDENHYSRGYHTYLVHSRIHRPGSVKWSESWHEHQTYTGNRVKSEFTLMHTKWLFGNRLKRMAGHGLEGWSGIDKAPFPEDRFGLTWPPIYYPKDDLRT